MRVVEACPRCKRDLVVDEDRYGPFLTCLRCGRVTPIPRPTGPARFRVVDVYGQCLRGLDVGDTVTVDASGAVAPHLCPAAEAVLRMARAAGDTDAVREWCCPIFDHLLVFRREA